MSDVLDPPETTAAPSRRRVRRARSDETESPPAPARPGRWRRRLRRAVYLVLLVCVVGAGALFAAINSVEVPEAAEPVTTSFVCLSDVGEGECSPSNSVAQFSDTEDRVIIRLDEMSPTLIDAVVAAEDRSFFEHSGVDPTGIARALYRDVRGSGSQQGGSTITQQYVKNVYLTSERTLTRKLREAALAIQLEREVSKDEILTRYLNEIYFGRGANGVEAAAQAYFGKDASALDVGESAYLAGLIRAPGLADATKDPEEATRRRASVLEAMVDEGYISRSEADEAAAVPWEGHVLPQPPTDNGTRVRSGFSFVGGSYVVEWARAQLVERFGESAVYGKGLRVYLTVDPDLQDAAFGAIAKTLPAPTDPAAAFVALDDQGRVVAMVGGRDFESSEVNYALGAQGGGSGRPAGSTFKAFALAGYVEQGNSITSEIAAPQEIVVPEADDGEDWVVQNYDDEDLGVTSVAEATWHSSNTAYVQITQDVGADAVSEMATRLGVSAPVPANPSVALGTADVSPLDLAAAYSTLSNRGERKPPRIIARVEDAAGNVLYDASTDEALASSRVLATEVADTVNYTLTGVIREGTATGARFRQTAAGKTGTTQNFKDAWFVGYTCRLTAAVWMGYADLAGPDQEIPTMENVRGMKVTGGTFPAEVWRQFMLGATEGTGDCTFPEVDAGTNVREPDPRFTTTTTTTPAPITTVARTVTEGPQGQSGGDPLAPAAEDPGPVAPVGPDGDGATDAASG